MASSRNSQEAHGLWKGDEVGYSALHAWVKRHLKKAEICEICEKPGKLDLANKSWEYKRDLDDWLWLCRKCHAIYDGRSTGVNRACVICGERTHSPKNLTCSIKCRDQRTMFLKLRCKRGHLKSEFVTTSPSGQKVCTECRKIRQASYYKAHPRKKVP